MLKKFCFCNYWGTWNRILKVEGAHIYELDLTPCNANEPKQWLKTQREVIRVHGTYSKDDIHTDELPSKVLELMVKHYGQELTDRMINFDYLSEVSLTDIKLANGRSNGGGVPLYAIKEFKDGQRLFWSN